MRVDSMRVFRWLVLIACAVVRFCFVGSGRSVSDWKAKEKWVPIYINQEYKRMELQLGPA
jgi:hypothetical protein